ncbi:VPLPA-CTERM sorting domain-containing protein [Parvularcula sp. LCG005]|uniref:VPLPA-CTERM sorting domain-containing protein n=1 Tax=Parvularcula sp. LCG005 TaxID=3078805 RepID=UPI002942E30F|nr:VPLPA-CTERM sorting domain-containing protein [Parvularcula sp. LCG005]WOI53662.1 VPLPA-CTERM sorting domain-containing protein [Parvularcula sp. LCG005]
MKKSLITAASLFGFASFSAAHAAPVYLNIDNISVEVSDGTSPGTFNNTFNGGQTIDKVIDAPSADAEEFHNQTTHIWYTADEAGGALELIFDFGQEYDISTLHFWNYNGESYDVDNIDFTFFNKDNVEVGSLSIEPDLGSPGGITAQDIVLAAPLNVQFVVALLSGTNRQVDFQNIGFTADVSIPVDPVPVPAAALLMASGLAGIGAVRRRRRADR